MNSRSLAAIPLHALPTQGPAIACRCLPHLAAGRILSGPRSSIANHDRGLCQVLLELLLLNGADDLARVHDELLRLRVHRLLRLVQALAGLVGRLSLVLVVARVLLSAGDYRALRQEIVHHSTVGLAVQIAQGVVWSATGIVSIQVNAYWCPCNLLLLQSALI